MTDKEIAEVTVRIVCALLESGPYNETEYPQVLKVYKAVSNQVLETAIDVNARLKGASISQE